jgi:hypothetical protein
MRQPEKKPQPGFMGDSPPRELLSQLFDRIENLTARLDRLSRSPASELNDFTDAVRRPGTQALNEHALGRQPDAQHVDPTDARIVPSLDGPDRMQSSESEPMRLSPYLDAKGASAYLGITLDSLYGIVERGSLVPLRGPKRRYRFTEAMLDEYLRRKGGGR